MTDEASDEGSTSDGESSSDSGSTGSTESEDGTLTATTAAGESDTSAGTETETGTEIGTENESDTETETDLGSEDTQGVELPGQIALTVENNAVEAIAAGQPVTLVFDHAQLVRRGAAPDGRDLRIIYHIGQATEMPTPYELDHDSAWNQADTRVWFSARARVLPQSTDIDNYHLIYGAPDSDPRASGAVFTVSEGFESGTLNPSRWQLVSQGDATATVDSGWLRLNVQSQAGSTAFAHIHSLGRSQRNALLLEARTWVSDVQEDGGCLQSFVVGASSAPSEILRSAVVLSDERYWYARTEGGGQSVSGGQTGADGDWHLYQLRWVGQQVDAYQDGRFVFSATAATEYPSPNSGWTQLMAGVRVGALGCSKPMTIEQRIDWIRMRPYIEPEPTAYLQSGQLR